MNKYIVLPREVMTVINELSEIDIKVLLYWYSAKSTSYKSTDEIRKLINIKSSYSEEVIDKCIIKLTELELITSNEHDTAPIKIQIERVLKDAIGEDEKLYKSDMERVYGIIRNNDKPIDVLKYAILLSQENTHVNNLTAIETFCKMLIKGDDLDQEYETLSHYVVLEKGIRHGIPNFKSFTRKDKELLYSWAKARISIDDIYDAYTESIKYTRQISFSYINVILSKKHLISIE